MNWKKYFEIGSYMVWRGIDFEGRIAYTTTKRSDYPGSPDYKEAPKPQDDDGGYHCLSWLLKLKGF